MKEKHADTNESRHVLICADLRKDIGAQEELCFSLPQGEVIRKSSLEGRIWILICKLLKSWTSGGKKKTAERKGLRSGREGLG